MKVKLKFIEPTYQPKSNDLKVGMKMFDKDMNYIGEIKTNPQSIDDLSKSEVDDSIKAAIDNSKWNKNAIVCAVADEFGDIELVKVASKELDNYIILSDAASRELDNFNRVIDKTLQPFDAVMLTRAIKSK